MAQSPKIDVSFAIDKKSAEDYNILQEEMYNNSLTIIDLGDGKRVNLLGIKDKVLKQINHVEDDRKKEIMEQFDRITKMKLQLGVLKRRAFGMAGEKRQGVTSLMEVHKSKVFEWFGMLYSEEDIQKKLSEIGLSVHISLIQRFRQQNKMEIEKLQHEYEMDWRSVSISRKRSRLDQLSYIYNKTKQEFDSASGTKQLPFSKEMREVLKQVRQEIEGDTLKLDVNGNININASLEVNKSTEELYSSINFLSLLIGRVSARFGINPTVLHYQLTNAWYAEFTGFKRSTNQTLKPNYPSGIVYNWDEIEEKYEKQNNKYNELDKNSQIPEAVIVEQKPKKETLRRLMLEKIKEMDKMK